MKYIIISIIVTLALALIHLATRRLIGLKYVNYFIRISETQSLVQTVVCQVFRE